MAVIGMSIRNQSLAQDTHEIDPFFAEVIAGTETCLIMGYYSQKITHIVKFVKREAVEGRTWNVTTRMTE
jgi:hypothetical protein